MTQETWLVVAVGAAFLLLGIAVSPLAWVAILHRRDRAARDSERGLRELAEQLQSVRGRLDRCESSLSTTLRHDAGAAAPPGLAGPAVFRRPAAPGRSRPARDDAAGDDDPREPKLITVPKLAAGDRPTVDAGLGQRYAAIWDLARTGATADVIARATGQPIGQIELILGLRRLDANRTTISHAAHE